jgi:hypothetical protein
MFAIVYSMDITSREKLRVSMKKLKKLGFVVPFCCSSLAAASEAYQYELIASYDKTDEKNYESSTHAIVGRYFFAPVDRIR